MGRFCPDQPISRAQVASMLARTLELAPVPDTPFVDVSGVHAGAINAVAGAGITNGCTPDRYCPDTPATRGQMMTFVFRALAG